MSSEKSLISLAVSGKTTIEQVLLDMTPEYFEEEETKLFVQTYFAKKEAGVTLDVRGVLEIVASEMDVGVADVRKMLKGKSSLARLTDYKSEIIDLWLRSQLYDLTSNVEELLDNEDNQASEILTNFKLKFDNLLGSGASSFPGIGDHISDLQELMAARSEISETGMTGLKDVDHILPTSKLGRFIVIAASTNHGKSSFATRVARMAFMGDKKEKVYIQSAELESQLIFQKIVQDLADIPTWMLTNGDENENFKKIEAKWDETVNMIRKEAEEWLIIEDSAAELSLLRLVRTIHLLAAKGVRRFVIDRAELFKEVLDAPRNPSSVVAAIGATLRSLAKRLSIDIILFAQSTNEAEKRFSGYTDLSHIYHGRALTMSATIVVTLYMPAVRETPRIDSPTGDNFQTGAFQDQIPIYERLGSRWVYAMEVRVAKNTMGPVGSAAIGFFPDSQRFVDRIDGLRIGGEMPEDMVASHVDRILNGDLVTAYGESRSLQQKPTSAPDLSGFVDTNGNATQPAVTPDFLKLFGHK